MATFQEFITRVRRELEESYGEVTWSNESIFTWTNDAIMDFGTRVGPQFDEQYANTVVGQDSYSMPDRTIDVVRVAVDDVFLARKSAQEFFTNAVSSPKSGSPIVYAILENTLYLYPTPDKATYVVRVWRHYYPSAITSSSSTENMPFSSKFDFLFGYYVKARAFEQIGDFDSMKMNDDLYQRAVDNAIWEITSESMGDYFWEPTVVW